MSKWTYISRTIINIDHLHVFTPLEEVIRKKFLTSLTGQNAFSDNIRDLLALPVRLGALGITNPAANTTAHYNASKKTTAPLTALIMEQSSQYPNITKVEQLQIKRILVKAKKHQQSLVGANRMQSNEPV